MRNILKNIRSQSFLEYAMLLIVIAVAVVAMQQYIMRSVNARLQQVQAELDESKR